MKALLLDGEDMFRPAWQQKCESVEIIIHMNLRIADYYEENGDNEKAIHQLNQAKAIIELLEDDLIPPFWKSGIHTYLKEFLDHINERIRKF